MSAEARARRDFSTRLTALKPLPIWWFVMCP